jgi:DNA-binding response OmpR family regulator
MAKTHILVVEDEQPLQLYLQKLLTGAGYRVSVAPEGKVALKLARSDRPDLVVMDLLMPGMDGYATCAMLKRGEKQALPVIVCSVRASEKDEVAAYAAGADAFVHKPVSPEALLAKVRELLARAEPPAGGKP